MLTKGQSCQNDFNSSTINYCRTPRTEINCKKLPCHKIYLLASHIYLISVHPCIVGTSLLTLLSTTFP